MIKISILLPYMYTTYTRASTARDFFANAATSWISGSLVVLCLSDMGFVESIIYYLLGYFAFISLYEIGYLANDTVAMRKENNPRDRLGMKIDKIFIIIFVFVRICIFVAITYWLGRIFDFYYWLIFTVLSIIIYAHNIIGNVEIKFSTFLQMSILRYTIPIYVAIPSDLIKMAFPIAIIIGTFCFTYPRFLTYQESKGVLDAPGRRRANFHLETMLICLPLILLVSLVSGEEAPLVVWAWHCAVAFGFMLLQRR